MENGDLAGKLTRLGLTAYEARAYVALIRRDSSTPAELARLAGVPRQRVYDVLATLVDKGLASVRPGSVVKYAAVPPQQAIEGLLAKQRAGFAEIEYGAYAALEHLMSSFQEGQQRTDPLEYIEVLRDRRAINERFAELQASIKHEILVFTKPPYATPPQENEEGVEVTRTHEAYSVYELSILEDTAAIEGVRRFVAAGENARFVDELPLKLVIIDETIVMFGMEDPIAGGADLTIVVVEHSSLARVLKIAFTTVWENALTFDEALERVGGARAGAV